MERNQKRIDEEKFKKTHFRLKEGYFSGITSISRNPFGVFEIQVQINASNGRTRAEIKNYDYSAFNKKTTEYESLSAATSAIADYFKWIDEVVKKFSPDVKKRADMAYNKIITEEIAKIKKETNQ